MSSSCGSYALCFIAPGTKMECDSFITKCDSIIIFMYNSVHLVVGISINLEDVSKKKVQINYFKFYFWLINFKVKVLLFLISQTVTSGDFTSLAGSWCVTRSRSACGAFRLFTIVLLTRGFV